MNVSNLGVAYAAAGARMSIMAATHVEDFNKCMQL